MFNDVNSQGVGRVYRIKSTACYAMSVSYPRYSAHSAIQLCHSYVMQVFLVACQPEGDKLACNIIENHKAFYIPSHSITIHLIIISHLLYIPYSRLISRGENFGVFADFAYPQNFNHKVFRHSIEENIMEFMKWCFQNLFSYNP